MCCPNWSKVCSHIGVTILPFSHIITRNWYIIKAHVFRDSRFSNIFAIFTACQSNLLLPGKMPLRALNLFLPKKCVLISLFRSVFLFLSWHLWKTFSGVFKRGLILFFLKIIFSEIFAFAIHLLCTLFNRVRSLFDGVRSLFDEVRSLFDWVLGINQQSLVH